MLTTCPICSVQERDPRGRRTPRWRGITLLHELHAAGIPTALASDNARDQFYAYGDLDMLEVFNQVGRLHVSAPLPAWPPQPCRAAQGAGAEGRPSARVLASAGAAALCCLLSHASASEPGRCMGAWGTYYSHGLWQPAGGCFTVVRSEGDKCICLALSVGGHQVAPQVNCNRRSSATSSARLDCVGRGPMLVHSRQLTACQRPQQVLARRAGEAWAGMVEGLAEERRTRKPEVDPA